MDVDTPETSAPGAAQDAVASAPDVPEMSSVPSAETGAGDAAGDGAASAAGASDALRPNALHLQGVDDLSTSDIEDFMVAYYNKPFQIEWINDTSLNVVYDDPEDAFQALVAVTAPEAFAGDAQIAPEQLRPAKPHPRKPEVAIETRFAFVRDQKTSGSRSKSRYYLMHGEPSRKQDLARFGTKRSQPMKYGVKNKDIIKSRRREADVGDLFPSKAPTVPLTDDIMDDLLPQKTKKPRRRNRKSKMPDLFASKAKPSAEQKEQNQPEQQQPEQAQSSIYQNMDY